MAIAFKSLPWAFGVEITGVDLSSDLSENTFREFVRIFYRHQFVMLRGQQITLSDFDAFSRAFGSQRPHFLDHVRMDGHPPLP